MSAFVTQFRRGGLSIIAKGLRWGMLAVSLVTLAGCILTSDLPDPALDVPDRYKYANRNPDSATPSLDWWRHFRSQELTVLMEEAQTVNLDIAAATARIFQADALARQAGASLLPTVDANSSVTRAKASNTTGSASSIGTGGTGGTGTVTFARAPVTTYLASLSASYEIDLWGKFRDALTAAEETTNANRFDRDTIALTTLASVANAYFNVLAAQDRLRVASNNIASAQRIYDAIKARVDVGTGSDLDLAQQQSILAGQRANVPPIRQLLSQNGNILATLVARPPERVNLFGGSLVRLATPRVTPGLPSDILTQRPDIRQQEALLAAATANVGSARAQFFPTIALTGQGGYQSAALAALFTPQSVFYNVAASATQPIFDGGRIAANFDYQRAIQDERLQSYRKAVVSAFADVDTALDAVKQTSERLRLQQIVANASRRAFQLSEQRLQAGTADIVTVLNTQLTLFQAEDSLVQFRLSKLLAIVSLYQALGGGWTPKAESASDAL